jgi:hypothetical protein
MNHVAKRGYLWMECPVYKQCITWIKEGTYGWDILNINNKSHGYKRVPMDGVSCLLTMNHVAKRGYLWMECPVYKQCITWIKEGTYEWDVLFTNNESCC